MKPPVAVCLMGPTATGKTDVAVALAKRFPFELISVDSAMVYRGMNIGTAKPDAKTLRRVPHRLVDIRDPEAPYSAGDFVRDATAAITDIAAAGRVPLLVGGTMLYFRALTQGIADLPPAAADVRAAIERDAATRGWPALHRRLASVDPDAAARIAPADRQRIQRSLEVYLSTGETLTALQRSAARDVPGLRFIRFALWPAARTLLHRRIERRLERMLGEGLLAEIASLMRRPGLDRAAPAMRAVAYRQYWGHLAGDYDADEAFRLTLYATRQLAKRQMTWLRKTSDTAFVDPLEASAVDAIAIRLAGEFA